MAKRPTIEQLARESGVSVATVDRVLNRRLPVRTETASRVYEAAVRIGFHAAGLIGQRLREDQPTVRLGFLLLKTDQPFYGAFAQDIADAVAAAQGLRASCKIDFISPQEPAEAVASLEAMAVACDAVAMVAPEHPTLAAAVERLKERGVPVFALLSDFAPAARQAYVGVHNGKVGRTAAWMIARCARPGKVALFVGSHRFHGHELREIGFRAFFREEAPDFTVLDTIVNLEAHELTHEAMLDLQRQHPDLAGVYVAGGGSGGLVTALREMDPGRRPVAVCNELTADRRAALAEGLLTMVIATPRDLICREIVPLMAEALKPGGNAPAQIFLPFNIYLPESV
ncbi:LacI family DNA-binding transcriptional regulator [Mesorhizobium sp. LHD-90]|uniref:LacI family DNA-binding transcriptional regulator n=1 Tax=Mesorhizobium sp. LHD-90 TaxID=3071414 RepID=UPI0027DEB035|nr:LacI family DNA-binding transcriptional regulator [Mesorhizobium sp. LHD-90]MDQ6435620.1 LacI family DNA-binding transcriptional regulator [Mesorhizobium sp. LHD-90]